MTEKQPARRSLRALHRRAAWAERWAQIIVAGYTVAAVLSVLTWIVRVGPKRSFRAVSFGEALAQSLNLWVSPSPLSLVVLTLTAVALLRRLRIGLYLAGAFQLLGAVSGVLLWTGVPLDRFSLNFRVEAVERIVGSVSLLVGIAALVLFWRVRREFPGRLAPGSRGVALVVLLVGLALTILFTIGFGELFLESEPTLRRALIGLELMVGQKSSVLSGRTQLPRGLAIVTGLLASLSVFAPALVLIRTSRPTPPLSEDDEMALRGLLHEYGESDSLGYFATRHDKSAVFSADRRAAVTHRVAGAVSLASGDPIGDPESWPDAIIAWRAQARNFGWLPATIATSVRGATVYHRLGMRILTLGDEAILSADAFSLAGPAMRPVRQAVRHARKAGLTCTIQTTSELSEAECSEVGERIAQWRGETTERGFSMASSRWGDPADRRNLVVQARTPTGDLVGVLTFVPWGRTGYSLDFMRRDSQAPNGVTELMVTELMRQSEELKIRRISLNFAVFRTIVAAGDQVGHGPVTRMNTRMLSVADRFVQLESLYRANEKYRPEWSPRYIAFPSVWSLFPILFSMGLAEGFLPPALGGLSARLRRASIERGRSSDAFASRVAELDARTRVLPSVDGRLTDQERHRRDKLARLRAAGREGYPAAVTRSMSIEQAQTSPADTQVAVVGRVTSVRRLGGVVFATLVEDDRSIQLVFERSVSHAAFSSFPRFVDRGDLVSAVGMTGASRTGEWSICVRSWSMAAKALRPIPDARTGLSDPETRLRHRELDLIVHAEQVEQLRARSRAMAAIRQVLIDDGFLEVETPILQAVHGGASARPFKTRYNAYNALVNLRIAPELFLKRLVVGGMGSVFEVARNFRNEGVDATHNPEFTALEAYQPFADYTTMRQLTERLVRAAATAVYGRPVLRRPGADDSPGAGAAPAGFVEVDLSPPFRVIKVYDAVGAALGRAISPATPLGELQDLAAAREVEVGDQPTAGDMVEELYAELVEARTTAPTFYLDFPVETSPLTRPHRCIPGLVERWDLVAFGMEIGTAYSELIDPLEQRKRLTEQSLRAAAGDLDAMEVDEDFLAALETGMPPTGGLGIGLDRLLMLILGTDIRGVLAFPFVKPTG